VGQRSRQDTVHHLDNQRRQEFIDTLEPRLIGSLGREEALRWFSSPNPLLDNEPPVEVIRNGDLDRVAQAAADDETNRGGGG
jgi:hypothetical protein